MPKIFRRGKTYYVRGRYKGVELYRSLCVEDEAQAYIEVGRLLEYIRGGGDITTKKMTVLEACEAFVQRGDKTVKPSTWRQMLYHIRILKQDLSDILVDDIAEDRAGEILLNFINTRRKAGVRDNSIKQNLVCLSSVLKSIKPNYVLPKNKVLCLAPQEARLNYLNEDEFLQILALMPKRDRAFICLARYTGLRKSDVYGLKWSQVDRDDLVISVKTLKTGKKVRVPIPKPLIPVINDLWSTRALGDDRVFRSGTFGTVSVRIGKAFKKACREFGRPEIRIHDLRHSFCTSLAKSGASLSTIADIVGHTTIQTTEKYVHFDDSDRKKTSERAFGGGKRK